ncbi:hypothetical protein [Paraburkholderia sp. JHI869]|uniref:hypothetical protein n=1 Tax=Paraburkholderia sp. JHI869 TaxID=3112959 RepID=UPI00316EF455
MFTWYALEQGLAPGIGKFEKAEIPDVSQLAGQAEQWIASFFLNSTLRGKFSQPLHTYVFNFLRRSRQAFVEHTHARRLTLEFLEGHRQSASKYVDALYHWEAFVGQSWHAYQLLAKPAGMKMFEKGDGSPAERLNAIYNAMKHVESRIENDQLPNGATVPVWLENEGLRSTDCLFEFSETRAVLEEFASWGKLLVDPCTTREKLERPGEG